MSSLPALTTGDYDYAIEHFEWAWEYLRKGKFFLEESLKDNQDDKEGIAYLKTINKAMEILKEFGIPDDE